MPAASPVMNGDAAELQWKPKSLPMAALMPNSNAREGGSPIPSLLQSIVT